MLLKGGLLPRIGKMSRDSNSRPERHQLCLGKPTDTQQLGFSLEHSALHPTRDSERFALLDVYPFMFANKRCVVATKNGYELRALYRNIILSFPLVLGVTY